MAELFAFRALRPAPEAAAQVASVPYDVVSAPEAHALAASFEEGARHRFATSAKRTRSTRADIRPEPASRKSTWSMPSLRQSPSSRQAPPSWMAASSGSRSTR